MNLGMFLSNRRTIVLLILIFTLGGLIRILSFSGYYGSDDGTYAELAYQIANGAFKLGDDMDISRMRVGLLVPVALSFKIAGPIELAMVIYPFILSMLGIFVAFLAGLALLNDRAGLVAAAIQAILPIDTRYASMLWPDLPAALWANVGILLLYFGSNRTSRKSKATFGILSGVALGFAWLTKESVAYLFPLIGIYTVWLTLRQKQNIVLLVGTSLAAVTIVMIESLTYFELTGDLFYRFHRIYQAAQVAWVYTYAILPKLGQSGEGQQLDVIRRILRDGPIMIFVNRSFGFVTGVGVLAIVYAAFRRLRSFLLPGLWFFSLTLMFNFGSTSLQSYSPFYLADRYLYPLLLPAVILTAGLIDMLIPLRVLVKQEIDRERLFWGSALAVGVVSVCLWSIYGNIQTGIGSPVERTISRVLGPGDRIYTDSRTAWVLEFFWRYPNETLTRDFAGMGIDDVPRGAYVLVNRNRVEFLNSRYGYALPKFYEDIPGDWLLEWKGNRGELYRVPGGAAQVP